MGSFVYPDRIFMFDADAETDVDAVLLLILLLLVVLLLLVDAIGDIILFVGSVVGPIDKFEKVVKSPLFLLILAELVATGMEPLDINPVDSNLPRCDAGSLLLFL